MDGKRAPLNRQGCVIAGSPGTHAASRTFKLTWELPNPKPQYFTLALRRVQPTQLCRTRVYINVTIVSPMRILLHWQSIGKFHE